MRNILLGIIPEALYFSLFIIFTKNYKNKRKNAIFTILMITAYIVLKQILPRNVYCHIAYMIYVTILMKIVYNKKWHISDLFVFSWASILLGIISIICMIPVFILGKQIYWVCYVAYLIAVTIFVTKCKGKFNSVYRYFISQWNRNYENSNKIKALTIRNTCVISFNIMVFLLNICMIFMSANS